MIKLEENRYELEETHLVQILANAKYERGHDNLPLQ